LPSYEHSKLIVYHLGQGIHARTFISLQQRGLKTCPCTRSRNGDFNGVHCAAYSHNVTKF